MELTAAQKKTILQLVQEYQKAGMPLANQGTTYASYREFDAKRREALREMRELLVEFLEGRKSLPDFKEANTAMSLKHNYWGFTGFSGQMTINQLSNWSHGSDAMTALLRSVANSGPWEPGFRAHGSHRSGLMAATLPDHGGHPRWPLE